MAAEWLTFVTKRNKFETYIEAENPTKPKPLNLPDTTAERLKWCRRLIFLHVVILDEGDRQLQSINDNV